MRRYSTAFFVTVLFSILSSKCFAQADCILGVGVTVDSALVSVFQLNASQIDRLTSYSEEVKYRQGILDNKLENIQKRNPQSNVLELSKLATDYNIIMDSMALVQTMIDKRLLALFNEKQYTLYRNLCREASRSPLLVVPLVYKDSLH
ncbi:hypothetical protein [Maribacter antarcticus]|uniref:hypothetical protein n=1 Tax=Maribacter antarcticus TaxID=505250 RepID=UPI00047E4ECD|nr:hypothetical protein [Maribacter antarcticus]